MKRGKIYIVPDETQILEDLFYREVEQDHIKAMQEFVDRYQLDIKLPENDSETAASMLAIAGHLVIKTDEDAKLAVYYIPWEITDRQNFWTHDMKLELSQYPMIGAFSLYKKEDQYQVQTLKGFDKINQEIDRKNLQCQQRKGENYVGKKI